MFKTIRLLIFVATTAVFSATNAHAEDCKVFPPSKYDNGVDRLYCRQSANEVYMFAGLISPENSAKSTSSHDVYRYDNDRSFDHRRRDSRRDNHRYRNRNRGYENEDWRCNERVTSNTHRTTPQYHRMLDWKGKFDKKKAMKEFEDYYNPQKRIYESTNCNRSKSFGDTNPIQDLLPKIRLPW